ncbi:inositol monophosphatase family protein [Mangrovicoccus ximenensis]|uniref:inositol monophosphatase family protein n=1 Tax=Mangrovicoccus ximenensis TaxID=1911570 RepID=UPI0013751E80|nr:inositol monophosphatase [Mangrovicoccus ximenensis]
MSALRTDEAAALVALVRQAGKEIILPRFRNLAGAEIDAKGDPTDLVTVADREAEAFLAAGARSVLPGCGVLGEEAAAADPGLIERSMAPGTCVVIDPVDGTFNFARGLGVFGVILAVLRDGETVFGLLYDPLADDWVEAHRGGGAHHVTADGQRRRLAVRQAAGLEEAEGTVPLELCHGPDRTRLMQAFEGARNVRSLRCSCHEYRMLASGQADFAVNSTANPWDHAAGVLALEEAGGCVLADGGAYAPSRQSGRIIAAGSRALAGDIAALAW